MGMQYKSVINEGEMRRGMNSKVSVSLLHAENISRLLQSFHCFKACVYVKSIHTSVGAYSLKSSKPDCPDPLLENSPNIFRNNSSGSIDSPANPVPDHPCCDPVKPVLPSVSYCCLFESSPKTYWEYTCSSKQEWWPTNAGVIKLEKLKFSLII